MADIHIAGIKVTSPADVKVGRFDLTKANRTASGRMVMEYIATKRRVDVVWRYIPDADLQVILNLLAANKPFFTLEYPDAGGQQTMTCYAGDINTSLWHTINGVRRWSEVSISFIEQ